MYFDSNKRIRILRHLRMFLFERSNEVIKKREQSKKKKFLNSTNNARQNNSDPKFHFYMVDTNLHTYVHALSSDGNSTV